MIVGLYVTDHSQKCLSLVDNDIKRCSQYLVDVQDTDPYTCTYPRKGLGSASLVTY